MDGLCVFIVVLLSLLFKANRTHGMWRMHGLCVMRPKCVGRSMLAMLGVLSGE